MMNSNTNVTPPMQTTLNSCSSYLLSKLESTITCESPSLPKEKSELTGQKSTRVCTHCGEEKHYSEFYAHPSNGKNLPGGGRDHRCKVCQNEYSRTLREAHKTAPPKPNKCDCCGIEGKKLVPDHIRDTTTVRGWLCNNCNKAIGMLGDTSSGVLQAYQYLTRNETIN